VRRRKRRKRMVSSGGVSDIREAMGSSACGVDGLSRDHVCVSSA
jgi:hypothetical protein